MFTYSTSSQQQPEPHEETEKMLARQRKPLTGCQEQRRDMRAEIPSCREETLARRGITTDGKGRTKGRQVRASALLLPTYSCLQ